MVVRNGLLVMLDSGPKYGYQLKMEFEHRTSNVWALNIGQVYTTLARLERDGLIEHLDSDAADSHQLYRITDLGRQEARMWFATPVDHGTPRRNELIMKVILSLDSGQDPRQVIQIQRAAAVKRLQEYTLLKTDVDTDSDLAWVIMLDSMLIETEAEVRWLDLVEARVVQSGRFSAENLADSPHFTAADARRTSASEPSKELKEAKR